MKKIFLIFASILFLGCTNTTGLVVNIDDDKTLWTAVTVWRDGSNRSISYDDASNILVDEIMLSFL